MQSITFNIYLNCYKDTLILILETVAFHILALRYVKEIVSVATLNIFLFLVSCEWISLCFRKRLYHCFRE